jgi:phospholipid transport system transporter-binding protein
MYQPTISLTVSNAKNAVEAGLRAIESGQTEINLSQLTVVDSAAVATLLCWQRAAKARAATLVFTHLPANLISLTKLYGVSELLSISSEVSHH